MYMINQQAKPKISSKKLSVVAESLLCTCIEISFSIAEQGETTKRGQLPKVWLPTAVFICVGQNRGEDPGNSPCILKMQGSHNYTICSNNDTKTSFS